MCLLLGIYSPDNKGEVLEVGDKLLIYIQHAVGGPLPMGETAAQPARGQRGGGPQSRHRRLHGCCRRCCCVDTSCWPEMESTSTLSLRITAGICKHKCVRSRVAVDFTLSCKTPLIHRLRREREKKRMWRRLRMDEHNSRCTVQVKNPPLFRPSLSRSLRTVCSPTYRGTSTCGTPCLEVC